LKHVSAIAHSIDTEESEARWLDALGQVDELRICGKVAIHEVAKAGWV
jgi:hypothetical protein